MSHRLAAVAVAIALGPLAAACGAETEDTQPRQPNTYASVRQVSPETQMSPPPPDMPGKGKAGKP